MLCVCVLCVHVCVYVFVRVCVCMCALHLCMSVCVFVSICSFLFYALDRLIVHLSMQH